MPVRGVRSRYTLALLDENGQPTDKLWGFPSVTEILDAVVAKPRLMHWYYTKAVEGFASLVSKYGEKLPADHQSLRSLMSSEKLSPYAVRDQAADKGSSIHEDLQRLAQGKPIRIKPENQQLKAWWEERGLVSEDILAVEYKLVSFKYGYAGTVDLIYKDPETGKITLTDLKTGSNVHWSHFVQAEAYRAAWIEEGNPPPDRVTILHVRPEHWRELVAPDVSFETFLAVKAIYDALPPDWLPEDVE